MIFRRALLREFIDLALAVFVVMFAIIMVLTLIQFRALRTDNVSYV